LEWTLDNVPQADLTGGEPTEASVEPVITSSRVKWRVKTWNAVDEEGYFSEWAEFLTIGVPPAPVIVEIGVESKPLIRLSVQPSLPFWIEVRDFSGASLFSSGYLPYAEAAAFRFPKYLRDGEYVLSVWAISETGFKSPTAFQGFVVSPPDGEKPGNIEIDLIDNSGFGAEIEISGGDGADKYVVCRDGEPIAETTEKRFVDYSALYDTEYAYSVFAVKGFNARESDAKRGYISERRLFIGLAPDFKIFAAGRVEEWNKIEAPDLIENVYVGRKYPTYTSSGAVNETLVVRASFERACVPALRAMTGRVSFIKGRYFGGFYGVLEKFEETGQFRNLKTFRLSVKRADYVAYTDN
jgi:hypothetical protein